MTEKKLYNPEGMYDLLFERCFLKRKIENDIRSVFASNGFLEIETPSMEFYNVFYGSINKIPEESLFKVMDEKGRIMALRPEMTIPSARVAVTKLKDKKLPLKLSYMGKCFKFDDFGGGKQREFTQAGVEIMGSSDAFTDAFVIATGVDALKSARMEEFTIELGQVEFFKGLMEQAGFDEDKIEDIRSLIDKKDFFGLEEWLKTQNISEDIKTHLLKLPEYFGGIEMLEDLMKKPLNDRSKKAIGHLIEIWDILVEFDIADYVAVDLGMVSKLNYYTGFIFKGMTYGMGFPILTGGRYDTLCNELGRDLPATGFSIDIDMALTAYQRMCDQTENDLGFDSLVCFNGKGRKEAIMIAKALKQQNMKTELFHFDQDLDHIKEYAKERNTWGIIHVTDDKNVVVYDLKTNTKKTTTIEELTGGEKL